MLLCFLEGSQGFKTMTFACFRRLRQKRMCGASTRFSFEENQEETTYHRARSSSGLD